MKRSFSKFVSRLEAIGLKEDVEELARASHVTLRALYDGPPESSIVAARRAAYAWLLGEGKSHSEVARLFDRALNGVMKMTRKT